MKASLVDDRSRDDVSRTWRRSSLCTRAGTRSGPPGPFEFDDHDRQVTRDWYNRHHNHPPVGLRDRDRLAPQCEARLRPGVVPNRDIRGQNPHAPRRLQDRLRPPARGYRYVSIGGQDGSYRVQGVIYLEPNF